MEKEKGNMDADGWLKRQHFLLSGDRLVNIHIHLQPNFKLVQEMVMKVSLYNLFRRLYKLDRNNLRVSSYATERNITYFVKLLFFIILVSQFQSSNL